MGRASDLDYNRLMEMDQTQHLSTNDIAEQ